MEKFHTLYLPKGLFSTNVPNDNTVATTNDKGETETKLNLNFARYCVKIMYTNSGRRRWECPLMREVELMDPKTKSYNRKQKVATTLEKNPDLVQKPMKTVTKRNNEKTTSARKGKKVQRNTSKLRRKIAMIAALATIEGEFNY